MSCTEFFGKTSNHPGNSAPLQPRFGVLQLLTICQQIGQPGQNGIFLETYQLPKLNPEESDNIDRQIMPSDIESVIKKAPNRQKP